MIWLILTIWVLIIGVSGGLLLRKWKPWLGWSVVLLTFILVAAVAVGTVICWDASENEALEADYGLLLGCALKDAEPTAEMIRRCGKALQWMEENPHAYLVVSGGDPAGQGRTEAAVMAAWLRNHGANPKKLLIEDQAADTRQNLMLSKALAAEAGLQTDTVLIITSEYHQTRAAYLAEKNGQQSMALSCHTPLPTHLAAAVREVYSFVKVIFETAG